MTLQELARIASLRCSHRAVLFGRAILASSGRSSAVKGFESRDRTCIPHELYNNPRAVFVPEPPQFASELTPKAPRLYVDNAINGYWHTARAFP